MRSWNCLNSGGFLLPVLLVASGLALVVVCVGLLRRTIEWPTDVTPGYGWGEWSVTRDF